VPLQKRYNESDIEVINRIDTPVDAKIVDTLLAKFPTSSALTLRTA